MLTEPARNLKSQPVSSSTSISGGVNLGAQRDVTIGGDVVGRDKITSYHGYTAEQVQALLAQIRTAFQPRPYDGRCPYKGLDVFEVEDAGLFFGRETLIVELATRVEKSRCVFITGPSGSGKSSLARAGLIHSMKQGILTALHSERWLYETMKPGRSPIDELARVVTSLTGSMNAGNDIRTSSPSDDLILHRWTEVALGDQRTRRAVILIDQFEEVFTQVTSEPERVAFLNLLTRAARIEIGRVSLLIAMRSDFVPNCAVYPQLNALLNQEFLQVGALSSDELVSAIARPALCVGLPIDPALVAHIIDDMRGEPGALPLMQFALKGMFDAQQITDGPLALTLNDYLARGGLRQALARHADAVFNKLSTAEQTLARQVFSGLIEIRGGAQATRRTATFNELAPAGVNAGAVETVIRELADARLITTDERDGLQRATVAHEALIEAWPWLNRLVDENREAISLQNQIAEDAQIWAGQDHDSSYLYVGARLANAREQLAVGKVVVSDLAQAFLQTAANAQQVKQRRQQYLTWTLISGLLIVAGIFGLLASVAIQQRNSAVDLQNKILAQDLATKAAAFIGKDDELALLLAIEATRVQPSFQTEDVLRRCLSLPVADLRLEHPGLRAVAFSSDGSQIVTAGDDTVARIWSWPSAKEIATLRGHKGWVVDIDYSKDGKHIVTSSTDGTARLWDTTTGRQIAVLQDSNSNCVPDELSCRVWQARFSPDSQFVATGDDKGQVKLWNSQSGNMIAKLPIYVDGVRSIHFGPDSNLILIVGRRGKAEFWDIRMNRPVLELGQFIMRANYSPDGSLVALVGKDGLAMIFNSHNGDLVADFSDFSPKAFYRDVNFSPTGEEIVIASADGGAWIWNISKSALVATLTGHTGSIESAKFSPHGDFVLTMSSDGTMKLWNTTTGNEVSTFTGVSTNYGEPYADYGFFDPLGNRIIAVNRNNSGLLAWSVNSEIGDRVAVLQGRLNTSNLATQFSADGQLLLTMDPDTLRVWDTKSWTQVSTIQRGNNVAEYVGDPSLSPDGSFVLTTFGWEGALVDGNHARLWSIKTGVPISDFGQLVTHASFSLDGSLILTSGWDRSSLYHLWSAPTLTEIPIQPVNQIGFGPCKRTVWVERDSGKYYFEWTGSVLKQIAASPGSLPTCGANDRAWPDANVSPDGLRVLAVDHSDGGLRQAVIVSDTLTKNPVDVVRNQAARFDAAAFSPDGRFIVTSNSDATTSVWLANIDELIDAAKSRTNRELTCQEKQLYLLENVDCS